MLPAAEPLVERGEQGPPTQAGASARASSRTPCSGQTGTMPFPATTLAQALAAQGAAAMRGGACEPGPAPQSASLVRAQRQSAGMECDPPQPVAQAPAPPPPAQAVPLAAPIGAAQARAASALTPPRLLTAARPMVVRVIGAPLISAHAARVGTVLGSGLAGTLPAPAAGPMPGPAEALPAAGFGQGHAVAPPARKFLSGPMEKPVGAPRPLKREVKALGPPLSGSKRPRAAADTPVWAPADGGPVVPGTRMVRIGPSIYPAFGLSADHHARSEN